MAELGEILRQAREEQGLSLADVEERTRIRHDLLEALEEEDYSRLPEAVYVRGFVRGYANALGLDPQPLLAMITSGPRRSTRSPQPILDRPLEHPFGGARAVQRFLLGVLSALAVAALLWWFISTYYLQMDPLAPLQGVSLGAGATPTATAPTATLERPTPADTPASLVETAPDPTLEAELQPTPTLTATSAPSPIPTATPTPTITAGVEVLLRVDGRTWVGVTVDGEEVFAALLDVGEEQAWTGDESIALVIGNAGGAYLTVNGEELGYLGADGEVVRIDFGPAEQP